MTSGIRHALTAALLTAATGAVVSPATVGAFEPTKFVLSSGIGWKVDAATGGHICTVASKDECQFGVESSEPIGFVFPETVAVGPNGNVYVGDNANHRIQELSPEGKFVLMFGWKVNKTTGGNLCTATSNDICGEGERGTGVGGQLALASAIAVDPGVSHSIYVLDNEYHRVTEYTEAGSFVLTIGGEVNETKDHTPGAIEAEKNLCTAASGDVCKPGVESAFGSAAHGSFKPAQFSGNVLAVGGSKDLLYVGDEGRVQEFEASGVWKDALSLAGLSSSGLVSSVAVGLTGDVFLADTGIPGVREYNNGGELQSCVIDPASTTVRAVALDYYGRLGVIEEEPGEGTKNSDGVLYGTKSGGCGTKISEFAPPSGGMRGGPKGLAFAAVLESDNLYVAEAGAQRIEVYAPIKFPEAHTCPAEEVASTSVRLCGEINPNTFATVGFFDYSPPAGSPTPVAFEGKGEAFVPFHYSLAELVPNRTYQYETVAEVNVEGKLVQQKGEPTEFHTTTPPPETPGEPSALFVKAQSVVLNASMNPEHAATEYYFEYGACAKLAECAVTKTAGEKSAQYAVIGVTQEVRGLAPQTTYRYRLVANNEFELHGKKEGGKTDGAEGFFKTGPAPTVEALTGSASAIAATSALVSGTVNGNGQPATYTFELGVYQGAATQYGVVFSGPIGAGTVPVEESLVLTGLQPGVQYAYRVVVESGYGKAEGETATFTTAGLPSVLVVPTVLAQLPVPPIAFPKEPAKVTPKKLTRAQKLANALKACAKKPKNKRAACRRAAQKKYGPIKTKAKKK